MAQASASRWWQARPANFALSQGAIALAYVALTLVALYPVFAVAIPPLIDYPNHLARLHVLTEIDRVPLLAERYAVDWNILPNLAMDIVVWILARWMPVAEAMRLFVALTLVLLIAGSVALHRAIYGRLGAAPMAVFLLLYNHVLIFGFVNYLFGLGLYLLVFAGWIATPAWPAWRRLPVFAMAAVALFFAHFFAFGVYGLSVGAYELWRMHLDQAAARRAMPRRAMLRHWAIALGQLVPAALLLKAGPFGERNTFINFGDLNDKLLALVSPVWCYGDWIDLALFAFALVLLVRGLSTGRLQIAERLRFPIVVLLLVAIVMPSWLLGVWGVDFRLPLALACLIAAASRIELPDQRMALAVIAVGLALFGARVWTIAEIWRGYDAQYSEFRRASQVIAPGARLLVVRKLREGRFDKPYWHMASTAVIDRSVFLPSLFKDRTAQPVHAADAYAAIDTPFGTPLTPDLLQRAAADPALEKLTGTRMPNGSRIYFIRWQDNFDYVLYMHFGDDGNPVPSLLRQVHAGSFFDIYKIVRGQE
ncbi:MAG: hypothetical protein IT562_03215 [Alphaproteobacteria bacterium]|nr:hypothetical protein [Alphaproteobacteria bacterium]